MSSMVAFEGREGRLRAAEEVVHAIVRESRAGGSRPDGLRLLRDLVGLPSGVIERLRRRMLRDQVDLDAALAAEPSIDPAFLVRRLARGLGLDYREAGAITGSTATDYRRALREGSLRLANGRLALVPVFANLGRLATLAARPAPRERPVLVTRQTLIDVAARAAGPDLAAEAAEGLPRRRPDLSAKDVRRLACATALSMLALFLWVSLARGGGALAAIGAVAATALFLSITNLRVIAVLLPPARSVPPCGGGQELPVYTVLVPAFREAVPLPGLLESLAGLDYPLAKLDVKILLEESDPATRLALERLPLPGWAEIVVLPAGEPQTKPRALNAGLLTARGAFTVIYDAEDRPSRAQLRHALAAFARGGRTLAVVQASLTIDGSQTGFWASQFRAEYAGLFRVMLPALARLRLPIPLGGTSNHFRTSALRDVFGWDAYNVTEDADLGIRLFRHGYRGATIDCPTEEEAPMQAGVWFRQRCRWMKGWIVTLVVHASSPVRLVRDAGPLGAASFLALGGGLVLSALIEPFYLALVLYEGIAGQGRSSTSWAECLMHGTFLASFSLGHLAGLVACAVGQKRAGGRVEPLTLLSMPFYWLCVSLATWWAVYEFAVAPHKWRKTEHVLRRRARPDGPGELRSRGRERPR